MNPREVRKALSSLEGREHMEERLSISEVAQILCLSKSTIYRHARAGDSGAKKVAGKWWFAYDKVVAHLKEAVKTTNSACRIPLSVDQFRSLTGKEPSCLIQSPFLKVYPEDFTSEDIRVAASALVSYFLDRDLSHHTRSWQDFILHQMAMRAAYQELIRHRIEEGRESPVIAQLNIMYRNFPAIDLTEEQMLEFDSWCKGLKDEEVTMVDIAKRVLEIACVNMPASDLVERNTSQMAEKMRHRVGLLGRDRLVRIAEGVIGSLIGAGIFELLRWALENVPLTFAPYAEAQVYEIEGVVLRGAEGWMPNAKQELDVAELTPEQGDFLMAFILHALVLMSFYGKMLQGNPLMLEQPSVDRPSFSTNDPRRSMEDLLKKFRKQT